MAKEINISYPRNVFIYLFIFSGANAFLAYCPANLSVKLWVGLLGLLLPLVLAFRGQSIASSKEIPICFSESPPKPPRWLWIFMTVSAVAIRLGQTQVPGYWPLSDDGLDSFNSIELAKQWSWHFVYGPAQHPPIFFWTLGVYFKIIEPSLRSLFLFPVLCSIAGFVICFFLTRTFFSNFFSFLCCVLMGFSFWPLYLGKYCGFMALFIFWEMAAFYFLCIFIKRGSAQKNWRIAALLGVWVALGFWVGTAWPVIAMVAGIAVVQKTRQNWKKNKIALGWFLAPVLISGAFYFNFFVLGESGSHVRGLLAGGKGMDWNRQFLDSVSNLTALFWGCDLQNSYGPVWGGVLNPVFGSFFLIGLLECYRLRKIQFFKWILWALLILILPGFMSRNFDLFRNVQLLPLLLLVSALGLQLVLSSMKAKGFISLILLAVLFGLGLDFQHLWWTYFPKAPEAGSDAPRTNGLLKMYKILKEENETLGTGAVFFDLQPNVADQTLAIATYPFNSVRNPKLSLRDAKWAALVVNYNYQPFLAERFPGGKWFKIFNEAEPELESENKRLLGIVRLKPENAGVVTRWVEADKAFRKVVWLAADTPKNMGRSGVFTGLSEMKGLARGDRLLESLYWEMVFDFHRWENIYGDKNRPVHYRASREAVVNALQLGYPTAYFYNEMGGFYAAEGDFKNARKAFLSAVQSKVNLTPARENLKVLDMLEKSAGPQNK